MRVCMFCTVCSFLISRAVQDQQLANFFYWYVTVEREDKVHGTMYTKVLTDFLKRLEAVRWDQAYVMMGHCS